jgi:predicted XRE-type DNA-binding protein
MTPMFRSMVTDMVDELNRPDQEPITPNAEEGEPPLLTKEEAIAEVKRWIERYKIDQNQIFAKIGELVIRYGDLIPHLEQETDEGRLLLRAISRGRVVRQQGGFPGGIDRVQN